MHLQLRQATQADIPFLLALRRETMDQHLAASGADTSEESHRTRVDYHFDCASILMDDHQTPLGLLKVRRLPDHWDILQIQLGGAWQGRGIGRSLIEDLIADATAGGASLKLGVLKANPARKLYERLGFEVIGEDAHEYFMLRLA